MELGLSRLKVNILPKFGSITHELTSLRSTELRLLVLEKEMQNSGSSLCLHQENRDYIVLSMVVSKVYKKVLFPEQSTLDLTHTTSQWLCEQSFFFFFAPAFQSRHSPSKAYFLSFPVPPHLDHIAWHAQCLCSPTHPLVRCCTQSASQVFLKLLWQCLLLYYQLKYSSMNCVTPDFLVQ